MKVIQGGITAPKGFLASGIHCGIKYRNKDLALIYSQVPCLTHGLFTQNKVQAAPIKVTRAHLKNNRGWAQAIVINSGNANCCTGKQGVRDAQDLCAAFAGRLGINPEHVLIASTGRIGKRLPVGKIKQAVPCLVQRLSAGGQGSLEAAQAIMTTDTKAKQIALKLKFGKTEVKIGGAAKGAGMICPHLATMLAFITTDAAIDKNRFKLALKEAVDSSFNLITVEGDTSTNDMVLALASGLAGNSRLKAAEFKLFKSALSFVCFSLAKMIIKDAEGATKFVQVEVKGAKDTSQAKRVASKIANSALVKTAIFGEKPNWGRIAACCGMADQAIKQDSLAIYLGPLKVMQNGQALKVDQKRLSQIFKADELKVKIGLGLGRFQITLYTCDLSNRYVKLNAEY